MKRCTKARYIPIDNRIMVPKKLEETVALSKQAVMDREKQKEAGILEFIFGQMRFISKGTWAVKAVVFTGILAALYKTGVKEANGAGKTTLMRMICTLLDPTKGTIRYGGVPVLKAGEGEHYRKILGYLPQDFGYYPQFSAEEYLLYIAALKGMRGNYAKARIQELLELVSLEKAGKKKVKNFSGGMKRRLGIAQAVLNDPEILVLDEPTAGLDPKERIRFRNLISEMAEKRIVLLSTHIESDVENIASEILIMKDGRIQTAGLCIGYIYGGYYVKEDGSKIRGIRAAGQLREVKNEWKGKITEETIVRVIKEDKRIRENPSYQGDDGWMNDMGYTRLQGYDDLRDLINETYRDSFTDYDYYTINKLNPADAEKFYEKREHVFDEWLERKEVKQSLSEEKRDYVREYALDMDTPYYYEYFGGWEKVKEMNLTLIFGAVIVICIVLAGNFSVECQTRADAIYFSTPLGKKRGNKMKIAAGFILATVIYWGIMLTGSAILLLVYGLPPGLIINLS